MAPLAHSLLLLLVLSSSSTLLTPAAAICVPRSSSPYQFFFDHFLQPPADGADATDYDDDDDDSPAPSPILSSVQSPAPAPASLKASPALAPVAPTPKPSAATSPAPKASAPVAATQKPSTATSISPSQAPKAAPSSVDSAQAKVAGAVADVAAGVADVLGVSGVLDPSLKPICDMVPYPGICEGNVKAAAPKSLKSVDVRSAFHLMMEAYTDEIREIRDKSRALVTSDLYSDPLNMCNRSLGGMLRTSKEMVTAFESDDGGSLKSGMDSLVSSLMSCKEKPTVIQKDMERLYNIWDNIEAIFEKLYPELDPKKMFPTNP